MTLVSDSHDAERILICGDREWRDRLLIRRCLVTVPKNTVVIEGEARGADLLAREEAEALGLTVLRFPADWDTYRKAAGPIRNTAMLRDGKPTRVWAYHDDLTNSKGTKNMVNQSIAKGLPVFLISHDRPITRITEKVP